MKKIRTYSLDKRKPIEELYDSYAGLAKNGWLSEGDFQNELFTLTELDLSRKFLTGRREVKINVYEIGENLIR